MIEHRLGNQMIEKILLLESFEKSCVKWRSGSVKVFKLKIDRNNF